MISLFPHSVLSLDEFLEDAKRLMTMFFNNEFEPAVEGIQYYSETSILHALALSLLHFLQMMLTMSKKQIDIAAGQTAKTVAKIEAHRYQRSYKNLLMKPNYNNFTDTQCQAEITYVLTNLIYGCMIALRDQSVFGIINAGYKVNIAYRTLSECNAIQKHKTNWVSEQAKKDFNSVCSVTEGAFEIVLSMFPGKCDLKFVILCSTKRIFIKFFLLFFHPPHTAKLSKLLEYIGFNCNQKHALELISQSCKSPDLLTYHMSSFLLTSYYGLIEFVYGLGDKRLDTLNKFCTLWLKKCPNGAFTHLITGITEMNKSNFHVSVHCFRRVIDEQDYWPQLHFFAHILLTLCYSILDEWDKALISAARLRDKCKWSSSLFYYLHSIILQVKLVSQTPEEQIETRNTISEQLRLVPSLKRKLGGIHVFHEELSITRSKKYQDKIDDLVGAGLEILYFWNMYSMMEDNHQYFESKIALIQRDVDKLKTGN